jgi:hypothetical protein
MDRGSGLSLMGNMIGAGEPLVPNAMPKRTGTSLKKTY